MSDEEPEDTGAQQLPVMWHQTLLTLVQCYRPYLSKDDCRKLKGLVREHYHAGITPEIRKCLSPDYQAS
jgi:essential nuclear protein 1